MSKRNAYLDQGISDDSDGASDGYDSEAAEVSKTSRTQKQSRPLKRRKLSDDDESGGSEDEDGSDRSAGGKTSPPSRTVVIAADGQADELQPRRDEDDSPTAQAAPTSKRKPTQPSSSRPPSSNQSQQHSASKSTSEKTKPTPGVIYLSSLPPYLKPSALRNILTQRGFEPITRLFLAPASKSHKASRKMYTEGWIEFASKKTAKRCVEGLNAMPVGGKKGGYYHDDLWNMKYLKGMGWSELMAGIREEKREEEGRRDEERRTIARETKAFVEGVEQGKKLQGIKKKRSQKEGISEVGQANGDEVHRTWRQYEVKGSRPGTDPKSTSKATNPRNPAGLSDDVRQVLGKIF